VTFRLEACRIHLKARRVIQFPPWMAGNVLRGALGKGLREAAGEEQYTRLFSPRASDDDGGPSGLSDRPRPFVLRCAELNGHVMQAGESFCFSLHLFDARETVVDQITQAFAAWADLDLLERQHVVLDLDPPPNPVSRIRIEFQTPTQLKRDASPTVPDFSFLLARARDRISTLRSLYGDGPLDIDFRALADRAKRIELVRSELRPVAIGRRSSRSGQRHSIGGLIGFAEYKGHLSEFIPYLEAASRTGVGRHCTWGNGQIHTTILNSDS
jgi:hypothetical protein